MSLRGLIWLTVLLMTSWSPMTASETYVLVVKENIHNVEYAASSIIRIPEGLTLPRTLTLTFSRQDSRVWNLSLLAKNDTLDLARTMLCNVVKFGLPLGVNVAEATITFDVLTIRESFKLPPSALVFPNTLVATNDSKISWEDVRDPKQKHPSEKVTTIDVDEFVPVEKEPDFNYTRIGSLVNYPEIARRNAIEGQVMVAALIGKDGIVESTQVLESVNPLLHASAVRAVLLTEYTPAIQNGTPVRTWVRIPITFKLK